MPALVRLVWLHIVEVAAVRQLKSNLVAAQSFKDSIRTEAQVLNDVRNDETPYQDGHDPPIERDRENSSRCLRSH